jgi:hypothetical protein
MSGRGPGPAGRKRWELAVRATLRAWEQGEDCAKPGAAPYLPTLLFQDHNFGGGSQNLP